MNNYEFEKTDTTLIAALAARYLLEGLRDITTVPSVGHCFPYSRGYSWPRQAHDWLRNNPGPTKRCNNRNVCTVCARSHEATVRKLFGYSYDAYVSKGYQPWWQTLEMGFSREFGAKQRYGLISKNWTLVLSNRRIKALRRVLDVKYLRVTEETLINKVWTPHLHVVWVFPPEADPELISEFLDVFSARWRWQQTKASVATHNMRVVHTAPLDEPAVPKMAYLFKSFSIKLGQDGVVIPDPPSRPLDYLMSALSKGDYEHAEIWRDYESGVYNLRRYKFSRNWDFSHSNYDQLV